MKNTTLNTTIIIKPALLFLAIFLCLASRTVVAQVCPVGFTADTVDWSALWDPAWNGTLGPHTMTTNDGVDVTVSFNVTGGAGCTVAAATANNRPDINGGDLLLYPDWPNSNCTIEMILDFSVGSPINVQNVEFTAEDVDLTGSWQDQVVFNGASTVALGASLTPVAGGLGGFGTQNCGPTTVACQATGTWNGPTSTVSVTHGQGPNGPANPASQAVWFTDVSFCYPDTVPVTLGAFKSNRLGDTITAKWQTLSESFNVGFTLWGNVANEWVALSDRMVRSKKTDTATVSRYKSRVNIRKFDENMTEIGLSSIDTNGTEEFYGPFEIGKSYGMDSLSEAIKWQPIRDAYERKLQAANYELVGKRWRKPFIADNDVIQSVSVSIPEAGIYRISYEELLARGVNFLGVNNNEIAVSLKGRPIPRDIIKTGRSRQFGPGSAIIFYGANPIDSDALYLDSLVYQISQNPALVAKAGRVNNLPNATAELQTLGRVSHRIEEDIFYDETVSSDDPWMMDELLVYANNVISKSYDFEFNGEISGEDVELFIQLNSITDFDEIDQDGDGQVDDEHHIKVFINELDVNDPSTAPIVDQTNDGTQSWQLNAEFSDSLLKPGTNTITIQSRGDTGYNYSLVYIDALAITVSETIQAGVNSIRFTGVPQEGGFAVPSAISGRLYGYAYTDDGNLARTRVRRSGNSNEQVLQISGISEDDISASYWVANAQGFLSTDGIWVNDQETVDIQQQADYVIIIDPALVDSSEEDTSDMQRFIDFREESGFDVAMYTVDDIVDEFGYGMKTPEAFSRFLKEAHLSMDFTHVLLVGGHTYDYLNRLDAATAPVNMIPTFYRRSHNLINFSPTDLPFSDLDGTGKPNVALGRWPVRTVEELTTIIDKTIAYEKQGGMADAQKALLIAERNGGGLENFTAQLDRVQPYIGVMSADGNVIPWTNLTRIDVDEIEQQGFPPGDDEGEANPEARRLLKEGIEAGQSLTIFAGHGSPTRWSNQNLFTSNNITELENTEDPTQVATLACYTTYYQSPSTNSLAHQFLFDEAGAVSINGSAVLGSIRGNELLLNQALEAMMQGLSMGEAVMLAKQKMIDEQRFTDTVLTWMTLGDPALTIRQ